MTIKVGPAAIKILGFILWATVFVVFVGRLIGAWTDDPMVPFGILLIMSTTAAIYQVVLSNWQATVALSKIVLLSPEAINAQIERQADQN